MINTVHVPASVHGCLDECNTEKESILLSIDTDVSLDGKQTREWLIVTPDRLTVEGRSPSDFKRSYLLEGIQSIRTVAGVGSGLLQAKVDDEWIDILRFSNAFSSRFHRLARAMERAREDKESGSSDKWNIVHHLSILLSHEEPLDPPHCSNCQLRLSHLDSTCPRCLQKGQILRRISELLMPHWKGAALLCFLTILGVVAELIPPKLQQYLVDHILSGSANSATQVQFQTALLVVVLSLAGSRLVLSLVGAFKGQLATKIGTELTGTLRSQMVTKLQSLAVSYYDRHQVGSMLSRVAHDSEALHGLMHQITGGFLLQVVQLVGVGAMLLWIHPKLAMFTLIPIPLVFLGSWVFWKRVYPRYYRLWDASSKQMSVLNGMLSGIRVVKAFSQEKKEFHRFHEASDHLKQWRLWVEQTNAWYSAAMGLVFSLGGLIVWYVGGRDVLGHEMTLGQLIAFLAYLAMFYAPLNGLTSFTAWLTSFLSGSKRVLELLDTPATIRDSVTPRPWEHAKGEIEFKNVIFGYDRNQPILRDISFRVESGEMVGVVGRSGSGKSTMVNLLSRFYDVQEGQILVDGIDIRDVSAKELRDQLGVVFQDSFLFRGTIWKNLSYGRPGSSIEQGLAAAKAAGAHDFICRQPLAYETLLGEQGAGLSGGEKQRLSIARTLLYDPRILILDEATSNIDAESEKSIQEALQVLVKGRTTIAIAHRLSTLRNADRILVFDRGRLIEQGTHVELLRQDGSYARLVRIQTQVTKDPSVDNLLSTSDGSGSPERSDDRRTRGETKSEATCEFDLHNSHVEEKEVMNIRFLDPTSHRFQVGSQGNLEVWSGTQRIAHSTFILQAFPASQPKRYLSVRQWTDTGDEVEVGMIRSLEEWGDSDRRLMEAALGRRYLLKRIRRIRQVQLSHGYLDFQVETDDGAVEFTMRWTQGQAVEFGEKGRLLIDANENRWVVEDIDQLPLSDREKFLQYVYW